MRCLKRCIGRWACGPHVACDWARQLQTSKLVIYNFDNLVVFRCLSCYLAWSGAEPKPPAPAPHQAPPPPAVRRGAVGSILFIRGMYADADDVVKAGVTVSDVEVGRCCEAKMWRGIFVLLQQGSSLDQHPSSTGRTAAYPVHRGPTGETEVHRVKHWSRKKLCQSRKVRLRRAPCFLNCDTLPLRLTILHRQARATWQIYRKWLYM